MMDNENEKLNRDVDGASAEISPFEGLPGHKNEEALPVGFFRNGSPSSHSTFYGQAGGNNTF